MGTSDIQGQRDGDTAAAGAYVEHIGMLRRLLCHHAAQFLGLGPWYQHSGPHMVFPAGEPGLPQHVLHGFCLFQAPQLQFQLALLLLWQHVESAAVEVGLCQAEPLFQQQHYDGAGLAFLIQGGQSAP